MSSGPKPSSSSPAPVYTTPAHPRPFRTPLILPPPTRSMAPTTHADRDRVNGQFLACYHDLRNTKGEIIALDAGPARRKAVERLLQTLVRVPVSS
jgi:hypothetical protein